MQAWSIQREQLGRYATMEAEYYLPSRLAAQSRLESLPANRRMPLATLCDRARRITYGVLKPEEVDNSHARMARIQNAEHGFIDPESLPFIDDSQFDEYKRSEVVEGDLVIAIGGYIGPVARISQSSDAARLNINRHLARVAIDPGRCDPYYVLAFLLSSTSQSLLIREVRGSVQAGVNLQDLRLHPVFLPDLKHQEAVGRLMRDTESGLSTCRRLLGEARSLLYDALQLDKIQEADPIGYQASLAEMFAARRWDSQHYRPRFQELLGAMDAKATCQKLRDIVTFNQRGKQPVYVEGGPVAVVNSQHIGPQHIRFEEMASTSQAIYDDDERSRLSKNDVVVYATGAYVGRTNIWLEDMPAVASNHVNILRVKPEYDPAYIALVLNSKVGAMQTEKHGTGSTQVELYSGNLAKFLIPILDPKKQREIGDKVRQSYDALKQSKTLLEQAKRRVEELIEQEAQA